MRPFSNVTPSLAPSPEKYSSLKHFTHSAPKCKRQDAAREHWKLGPMSARSCSPRSSPRLVASPPDSSEPRETRQQLLQTFPPETHAKRRERRPPLLTLLSSNSLVSKQPCRAPSAQDRFGGLQPSRHPWARPEAPRGRLQQPQQQQSGENRDPEGLMKAATTVSGKERVTEPEVSHPASVFNLSDSEIL